VIRSDPSTTTGGASERCTRTTQRHLLLLGPARCSGVVDGISSTTAWCLWWRVYAGRASPTRARWKKTGKRLVKLGLEERQRKRRLKTIFGHMVASELCPFIGVSSFRKTYRLVWRRHRSINPDRSIWTKTPGHRSAGPSHGPLAPLAERPRAW
jgi:hypothetical protein